MLPIDLTGKRALVCGVADEIGFGWATAKALAEAGASLSLAVWPPALAVFRKRLERGELDAVRRLSDGRLLEFAGVYPLDAAYDSLAAVPESVRTSRKYAEEGDFSIGGLAQRLKQDFGDAKLDVLVHSLANSPEINRPLLDTSRSAYTSALGVSAFSLVSLVHHLGPMMSDGGSVLSLSFLASERTFPGYGGGMSSAKAALESDTRTLAYEAGRRHRIRVNVISAGPLASRAATAIGSIETMLVHYEEHSPLPRRLRAEDVANVAAFLSSALGSGITGTTVYVDNGYHSMGKPLEESDPR